MRARFTSDTICSGNLAYRIADRSSAQILILLVVALIVVPVLSGCSRRQRMSLETYDKILVGMKLAQVETVMGIDAETQKHLVQIDETKTSKAHNTGIASLFGTITHENMQVDDNGKIARYSYVPINDPSHFIVVYSYSKDSKRMSVTVRFDRNAGTVVDKGSQGL